jgi:hypothetical protein
MSTIIPALKKGAAKALALPAKPLSPPSRAALTRQTIELLHDSMEPHWRCHSDRHPGVRAKLASLHIRGKADLCLIEPGGALRCLLIRDRGELGEDRRLFLTGCLKTTTYAVTPGTLSETIERYSR